MDERVRQPTASWHVGSGHGEPVAEAPGPPSPRGHWQPGAVVAPGKPACTARSHRPDRGHRWSPTTLTVPTGRRAAGAAAARALAEGPGGPTAGTAVTLQAYMAMDGPERQGPTGHGRRRAGAILIALVGFGAAAGQGGSQAVPTGAIVAMEAVLEPAVSIDVLARTAGCVQQVRARVGDQVQAGDTLACLDDRQARLRLQAARLAADQQQQRLARMRPLLAQGGIATLDLLTLENQAQLAQLRVEEAMLEAEGCVLLAPVAGAVAAVAIAPGQPVAATMACVRLIDRHRLKAQLYLPLHCLAQVHAGQHVVVRAALPSRLRSPDQGGPSTPGQRDTAACRPTAADPATTGTPVATGYLDRVDPEVMPGTDRVGATASVAATPGLLPGLVVRVEVMPR